MARSHSCFFPSLLLAASPSSPSSACGCGPATLPGHCHGQVPRRRAHQQCGVGGSVREGREEVRGPGAPPGLLPRAALQRVHLGCGRHEELRGGRCPAAPMLRGAQQAEPCPRGAQDTAAVWTRVSPPPVGSQILTQDGSVQSGDVSLPGLPANASTMTGAGGPLCAPGSARLPAAPSPQGEGRPLNPHARSLGSLCAVSRQGAPLPLGPLLAATRGGCGRGRCGQEGVGCPLVSKGR